MTYPHAQGRRRLGGTFRSSLAGLLLCLAAAAPALAAGTLDKVRDSGKLALGYRTDARPFSYTDAAGKAAGFSVSLCLKIADAVQAELKLPALAVDVVPVTAASRFEALHRGQIDLLCETATPTLERRSLVDFSIPVFYAGVGAVVRTDAATRLRDALADRPEPFQPIWRAAPGAMTENVVFAVVGATTIERSLIDALKARRIVVSVKPVPDYGTGLQMVLDRRVAALFGDRPVLLDAAMQGPSAGELLVIERNFTRQPLALAMRRDDPGFRLLVDRTLSRLYRSKDFAAFYTRFFGEPDTGTLLFFQALALPD